MAVVRWWRHIMVARSSSFFCPFLCRCCVILLDLRGLFLVLGLGIWVRIAVGSCGMLYLWLVALWSPS